MSLPFCNVALPVPLRSTFTYAIPDALRESILPGSRVLVPFRNKSLVGVVVECVPQGPEGTKIREITKALDFLPALTPKLIELAHWIAGYYLAPIGEVFRAMLPPITELRTERQIVLTESGRAAAEKEFAAAVHSTQRDVPATSNPEQHAFLSHLRDKGGVIPFASAAKLGVDAVALQRLRRAGLIEFRESVSGRKAKTQRVIALKSVGA
jgi:primosomal protein N' (replication factor Y) (superfamily II helicase)